MSWWPALASDQGHSIMKINWVLSASYILPVEIDVDAVKNIGSTWGSYRSWRSCNTDNVICHDLSKSRELLKRAFQAVCNFYVPRNFYQDLGRPLGIKLYDGELNEECQDIEDIISMHLAAHQSDIVLLAGFDFSTVVLPEDRFEQHRIKNRMGLMRGIINGTPQTQWVLVDHPGDLDKAYQNLPNLTCDVMTNVLKLLL
jgi:hypothetical protein